MNKLILAACLVLAVLLFVIFAGNKAVVRQAEKRREKYEEVIDGWEKANDQLLQQILEAGKREDRLLEERDRLRAELKAAAEALKLEEEYESVELGVFRGRLQHVEQELQRARAERDKLFGELAGCKAERDAAVEEFVRVLDRCEKLEAVVEAKDDAIQRLGGDVNCLREELEKAQGCVRCHQNNTKHRRHK